MDAPVDPPTTTQQRSDCLTSAFLSQLVLPCFTAIQRIRLNLRVFSVLSTIAHSQHCHRFQWEFTALSCSSRSFPLAY